MLSNHPYMVNKSRYIRYEAREWGFGVRRSNAVLNRAFGSAWDAERERERPVRFGRTPLPNGTEPSLFRMERSIHLRHKVVRRIPISSRKLPKCWQVVQPGVNSVSVKI